MRSIELDLKMLQFLKKPYFPILLLIASIAAASVIQYYGISQFKSLPSNIHSGDYYFQMGAINHIRYGGNPLASSSMREGMPGYLPLYGTFCAALANIFRLETHQSMFFFSIILFAVSSILWFCLFKFIFGDNSIALLGAGLGNLLGYYPILKYTQFTRQIILPLFLIALVLALKKRNIFHFILLGLIYGLSTLSHIVFFIGATLILLIFFILDLIYISFFPKKPHPFPFKSVLIGWIAFSIVSLPILMLYWYRPFFVFHLSEQNDFFKWNTILSWHSFSQQIKFFFETLKLFFFSADSPDRLFTLIFFWVGLYGIFKLGKNKEKGFFITFILCSFFVTFCYFLTVPALDIHFIPNYMATFFLHATVILVAGVGLFFLKGVLKLYISANISIYNLFFGAIFLLLFFFGIHNFMSNIEKPQWINIAKDPIANKYLSLQKYLFENTDIDDVILSNKYFSFTVNAISGRKIVVNRWTHQNDPFMDFSQRDTDAAVILYGIDFYQRMNCISKYCIKYLYWEKGWTFTESYFDKNGKINNIANPFHPFDQEKYRRQLDLTGIKYKKIKRNIETAFPESPEFNLLAVLPVDKHPERQPWNSELCDCLEEVWSFSQENDKIACLYRFKTTNRN